VGGLPKTDFTEPQQQPGPVKRQQRLFPRRQPEPEEKVRQRPAADEHASESTPRHTEPKFLPEEGREAGRTIVVVV
jgi:hypothetical protein